MRLHYQIHNLCAIWGTVLDSTSPAQRAGGNCGHEELRTLAPFMDYKAFQMGTLMSSSPSVGLLQYTLHEAVLGNHLKATTGPKCKGTRMGMPQ